MKKMILKKIVIIIIVVICLVYLKTKVTYTSYESKLEGSVNSKIANWNILINNQAITTNTPQEINIDDIVWETEHTKEGKLAPGSKGIMKLIIDPKGTEVGFNFALQIIDKQIDPTKILTVTSITSDQYSLKKDKDTYTGTFPLIDIKNNQKEIITISLEWVEETDTTEITPGESTSDDFIIMTLKAYQKI